MISAVFNYQHVSQWLRGCVIQCPNVCVSGVLCVVCICFICVFVICVCLLK